MKNPFDYFDVMYCINLDSRTDRLEKCQEEFIKMGILSKVERQPGIISITPSIGNHLAHAQCLRNARASGANNCFIFEDDVEFFFDREETYKVLDAALSNIPKWDMLYLGINMDIHSLKKVTTNLVKLYGGFSTHAYAVHSDMFEKLIKINEDPNTIHNDVSYSAMFPTHNVYCTNPLLAGQRTDYSDIQGTVMSSNEMFKQRFRDALK